MQRTAFGRGATALVFFTTLFSSNFSQAREDVPLLTRDELDLVRVGQFSTPPGAPDVLRVVTWNIEYGSSFDKIVKTMREEIPADIYFLQEVDVNTNRTRDKSADVFRDIPELLGRALHLNYAYGIEFQELMQDGPGRTALTGQATLSRFDLRDPRVRHFDRQPADWSKGITSWFQKRNGGRMFLYSMTHVGATPVHLYNAHLENQGSDQDRLQQMEEILADIRERGIGDEPILVAGDLNTFKGRGAALVKRMLAEGFSEPLASKSVSTHVTFFHLDWLFSKNLTRLESKVHPCFCGSDHRPVVAEFRLN